MIVANKVADDEDEARIRAAFSDAEIVIVPVDPVVNDADRRGVSPVDVDAGSPAVVAISEMSELLHP